MELAKVFVVLAVYSHNRLLAKRQIGISVSNINFGQEIHNSPHYDSAFFSLNHLADLIHIKRFDGKIFFITFVEHDGHPRLDSREVLKSLGLNRFVTTNCNAGVCGPYNSETMDEILEACLMEEQAREAASQAKLRRAGFNLG